MSIEKMHMGMENMSMICVSKNVHGKNVHKLFSKSHLHFFFPLHFLRLYVVVGVVVGGGGGGNDVICLFPRGFVMAWEGSVSV